jgi:predicted RNA binding protein YcfA (HicA-like mRNA interferase family)
MAAIRPIHFQRLIRVFERDGFRFDRQEGDHRIYIKAGVRRPLVIPTYHAVPVFIIKTSSAHPVCPASGISNYSENRNV